MTGIAHIPIVRIFIPFLAGIISAVALNIVITTELFLLIVILLTIFLFIDKKLFEKKFDKRWIYGLLISIFFFSAGNSLTINHNELTGSNHFSKYLEKADYAVMDIIEPVSERENSYRVICRIKKLVSDTMATKVKGKVMLYVEKDSVASKLNYGDRIITNSWFSKVSSPQNPYQFNYKRHLAFNNIHYQGYRPAGDYMVVDSGKGNTLKFVALDLRQKALATLQKYGIQDREFAVLSALLLGHREYIDTELRQQFAGAGAMHILCVSGLHVGIIYIILNSIFSFLNKSKKAKILKTIIVISLIWFYATLTGYSPSVLRASTMFSFVALARSSNRYTNIYNILAASAFVLTIIDPYIIAQIGFQLSYLAVISIVTLQPPMYNLFYVKTSLLDKAWAITTVSVAAQIATGPLALYYFNIFPNYFILTNLAVIPLSSIIIYSALIFLAVSPIGFIAELMGKILSFIVLCMHRSVQFIESLPYSNLQDVNINLEVTFLMFFFIITLSIFFIKNSKLFLKLALTVFLLLVATFSAKNISQQSQNMFIVYSINNHTAIDFISGQNCSFLTDKKLQSQGSRDIEFNIIQNRINHGIDSVNTTIIENDTIFSKPHLWRRSSYFLFHDLKIKVLTELDHFNEPNEVLPIELDYLIISQNPWLDISDLVKRYDFDKLIIDSSNSLWKAKQWAEECDDLGLDYWDMQQKGAYIKNLQ